MQTQSTNQTIERSLFNDLVLLRCYDKKDMVKDIWIGRYGFESLAGKDQYDWRDNWTRQGFIIDGGFMLY
jgi:hypothetical protein